MLLFYYFYRWLLSLLPVPRVGGRVWFGGGGISYFSISIIRVVLETAVFGADV